MTEPVTSSAASATVATVAAISILPGVPAPVVIGAFAGSVLFVVTSEDLSWRKKAVFFLISFIAGFLGARFAADLIGIPLRIVVNEGVGALAASACAVRVLIRLIRKADSPDDQLPIDPRRPPHPLPPHLPPKLPPQLPPDQPSPPPREGGQP